MNLLIMTLDPPSGVGGIEGRAIAYKRELSALGHSVTLVSISRLEEKRQTFPEDFRLSSSLPSFCTTIIKIVSIIKRRKVESVFLLGGSDTAIGIITLSFARVLRLKTASLFYGKDILQSRKSKIKSVLHLISLYLTGCIATNSRFTSYLLNAKVKKTKKIVLLYPGINVDEKVPRTQNIQDNDQTILFVGRLVRRKGLEYLIRAMVPLKSEFPHIKLVVVGDGPEFGRMSELVNVLGLKGNVRFAGELRGDDLSRQYEESVIFSMPSITLSDDVEGFGTVFLEAGLHGLPSVSTFSGGIPEAVIDGTTGILVKERDPAQLAEAIRLLLLSRQMRQRMGEEGRNRVLNQFTWRASANRLLTCFE